MSEWTKTTSVDLGDDLLETRTISRDGLGTKSRDPESSEPESADELLLNAKILIGEGLLEDAKKTLRRVLRSDPASLAARDRLEEIQKIEIKRLLGQDDGGTGGGFVRSRKKSDPVPEDGESVAAELERELGPSPAAEDRFFPSEAEREAFSENLEKLCSGASARDRIDLGIGFLEMELHSSAIAMFRGALAMDPSDRRARALLATAFVEKGDGFEAMIEIETLIADHSSAPEEKVDFGYLAGRAQELLGNHPLAARWYRAVLQIVPGYRDAEDRFRRSARLARVR